MSRTVDLETRAITDVAGALVMARIRNVCREGFAYDNGYITEVVQQSWWLHNQGRVRAWLYDAPDGLAGFGLLRRDSTDGLYRTSVAVLPEFAGRGYGGYITSDLVLRAGEPCRAAARLDNPAAMRLHRGVLWQETGRTERLAFYATRAEVWG